MSTLPGTQPRGDRLVVACGWLLQLTMGQLSLQLVLTIPRDRVDLSAPLRRLVQTEKSTWPGMIMQPTPSSSIPRLMEDKRGLNRLPSREKFFRLIFAFRRSLSAAR